MDVVYTRVTSFGARSITGARSLYSDTWLGSDPLLCLAAGMLDVYGFVTPGELVGDHSTYKTVVKDRRSVFDVLALLNDVLSGRGYRPPSTGAKWKPRIRFSIDGLVGLTTELIRLGDTQFATHDSSIDDLKFKLYHVSGGETAVFFESLRDFAQDLYELKGPDFHFENQPGATFYPRHNIDVSNFKVSEKVISYDVHLIGLPKKACSGGSLYYSILIRMGSDHNEQVEITVSDTAEFNYINCIEGAQTSLNKDFGPQETVWVLDEDSDRSLLFNHFTSSPFTIVSCHPMLYHTQGEVIARMLGKASRNFETLMESSGFVQQLATLALGPSSRLVDKFLASSPLIKMVILLKLALAGRLFQLFAVNPALETIQDVIQTSYQEIKVLGYESERGFSGDEDTFLALPENLRAFIETHVKGQNVIKYDISFRSQGFMTLTEEKYIQILLGLLRPEVRFGVVPQPTYIWAALPFSFIVDMFLPISSIIKHMESTLSAVRLRGVTVGHSVRLTVHTDEGTRYHTYIRSDPSNEFIDPPRDSWLQSPGVYWDAVIPMALLVIL